MGPSGKVSRLGALGACSVALALIFGACGSDSPGPSGPGGAGGASGAGGDAALCPAVPTCSAGGGGCPSIFPTCMGEQCCLEGFGCLECSCDAQCPRERRFCQEGLCSECSANRDCPAGRACCAMEPSGGRYRCVAC